MNANLMSQLILLKQMGIKPNFSALAREHHVDRRTIKKYYDGYQGKPKHRDKHSKLDKHLDLIKLKLGIKGCNKRSVYQYLLSEVDQKIGSYSNFSKYVKGKNLLPQGNTKGHPRFETAPGFQGQADWKENFTLRNRNGEKFTIQIFDYKLGCSRYCHFEPRLTKTRQDVFDCLIASFKATGGVPKEILFDNMASIVDLKGRQKTVNPKMRAFAKDFGFRIRLCKARHAYTKGKVETINKFVEWLRPYDGEFDNLDQLKAILAKINQTVNTQPSQATNMPALLLWQKEKEYLGQLPNQDIIESYMSLDRQITVHKDSLIAYGGCRYSVPAAFIGKTVQVKQCQELLHVYYNTELLCTHHISTKKINYQTEHYRELLSHSVKDTERLAEMTANNLKLMDQLL